MQNFKHCRIVNACVVRRPLTQDPLHDQHLCPGELGGLDPEHLAGVIRDGLIGQVLDALEAVGGVDNQQTQEDGEGHSMSHKLHEGASQDLTNLEERRRMCESCAVCTEH